MNDIPMHATILDYIRTELLPPGTGPALGEEDDLLDVGALSSMQFMRLIGFVERRAGLRVPPEDMVIENFRSVAAIGAYLAARGVAR